MNSRSRHHVAQPHVGFGEAVGVRPDDVTERRDLDPSYPKTEKPV
jgi:hypothetical protein